MFRALISIIIATVSSWGLVWEREWSGDPPGVRRPESDPPGDQAAAPAARHDLGRATAIRFCCHRGSRQEGGRRHARAGIHHLHRWIKHVFQTSVLLSSQALCGCLSLRWTLPVSSSWVLSWPPSRRSWRTWTSWGEWRLTCLLFFAANMKVDPWYSLKKNK